MDPLVPSTGLGVLHLFCKAEKSFDKDKLLATTNEKKSENFQIIAVSILGHKADFALMILSNDWVQLRQVERDVSNCGARIIDSYVSLTEISEYAAGVPEEMRQARLYPELPPADKRAWCFYPMSKRRNPDQNWYTLNFEKRKELMYEHGASGRKFAGRVLQVITGSTGIDDFEWGVTLFCTSPDDLKDVVYTMRFDEASAEYAEFGPFYLGVVANLEAVLNLSV